MPGEPLSIRLVCPLPDTWCAPFHMPGAPLSIRPVRPFPNAWGAPFHTPSAPLTRYPVRPVAYVPRPWCNDPDTRIGFPSAFHNPLRRCRFLVNIIITTIITFARSLTFPDSTAAASPAPLLPSSRIVTRYRRYFPFLPVPLLLPLRWAVMPALYFR